MLSHGLVPPVDSSGEVPFAADPAHEARLRQCEAHLAATRAEFAENTGCLAWAAGNSREIAAFLADPRFDGAQKEALLSTLRHKDFVDITRETLEDALSVCRGAYPEDVFRNFVLAPRIADEMLLPQRRKIRALFPEGFSGAGEILAWMQKNMEILPDQGVSNFYPSPFGCLRHRQVPGFAWGMVFVALCRAFSLPARLDTATGRAQWWEADAWQPVADEKPPVKLTLTLPAGQKANYFEHLTIGLWDGRDYVTLKYPNLTLVDRKTFLLQPGDYRITATTRQIDGTASVTMHHIRLSEDTALSLSLPADQTARRLKKVPLSLPDGPVKTRWSAGKNGILIFADPGSEPTEHLLREMLEHAELFRNLDCPILLVTELSAHPTVRLLQEALPEMALCHESDPAALSALHLQMGVGDLRLPFVVCADALGRGVYASANYRIRLAQTLADVQKLLQ